MSKKNLDLIVFNDFKKPPGFIIDCVKKEYLVISLENSKGTLFLVDVEKESNPNIKKSMPHIKYLWDKFGSFDKWYVS